MSYYTILYMYTIRYRFYFLVNSIWLITQANIEGAATASSTTDTTQDTSAICSYQVISYKDSVFLYYSLEPGSLYFALVTSVGPLANRFMYGEGGTAFYIAHPCLSWGRYNNQFIRNLPPWHIPAAYPKYLHMLYLRLCRLCDSLFEADTSLHCTREWPFVNSSEKTLASYRGNN